MSQSTPIIESTKQLYLLRVDAIGTLLLVKQDQLAVGGSGNDRSDVRLQTENLGEPVVIAREGDQYLARSTSGFDVDSRSVTSKLLLHGETLTLGQRGRLRFRKPVPASATAILQPTAANLVSSGAHFIVMMADAVLFGARAAHFCIPDSTSTLVLMWSDGEFRLHVFSQEGPQDNQGHQASLGLDQPTLFEDVHFTLSRYPNETGVPHAKV